MKPAVGGGTTGFTKPKQYYAVFSVPKHWPDTAVARIDRSQTDKIFPIPPAELIDGIGALPAALAANRETGQSPCLLKRGQPGGQNKSEPAREEDGGLQFKPKACFVSR